ncbi:MAG: RNA methyltransferase [Acidobacteria bacterium]|nr:RNA methyltransferase [Acidobacteriota bacterium]
MATIAAVSSLDDPRIAAYRWTAEPARLEAEGLFVVEGRLVVPVLLAAHACHGAVISDREGVPGPFHGRAQSVLVSPAALEPMRETFDAHDVPVFVAPQTVLDDLVGFRIHRGCLALATRPPVTTLTPDLIGSARVVLVLEGVNNPDNIGGIFRSAAALGADLVVLDPGCGDPLYRKAIRTSMGATLQVPWARATSAMDALSLLQAQGVVCAALTPSPSAVPLPEWMPSTGRDTAAAAAPRVALVAGAEGGGLSAEVLTAADVHLRIPMTDRVDSLNVATATAIALYHVRVSVPS